MFIRSLLLLLTVLPALARADGMAYKGMDRSSFYPVDENEQLALISHRNGRQQMLLAINIDLEDTQSGFWIVPVPAAPEAVTVDLTDRFPTFRGANPRQRVHQSIDDLTTTALATQLIPCLFLPSLGLTGASLSRNPAVERYGLRCELVSPHSPDELQAFLQSKSITIPPDHLASFAPYLNDQYSLVVTWIQSREQLVKEFPQLEFKRRRPTQRMPCLFLTFPTARPFFPLRPTAGYGDAATDIRLFILDHVAPDIAEPLRQACHADYFLLDHFVSQDDSGSDFPPGFDLPPESPLRYTRIQLAVPARQLTADLSFTPASPPWTPRHEALYRFLGRTPTGVLFALTVLYTALLSTLAGAGAGLLLHRRATPYAFLALWNLTTLVGLGIRLRYYYRSCPTSRPNPILTFLLIFFPLFLALTLAGHALMLWLI